MQLRSRPDHRHQRPWRGAEQDLAAGARPGYRNKEGAMPDPDPTPTPPEGTTPPTPPPEAEALGDAGKKALSEERAARKAAEKAARDAQAELDRLRQASMSDQEKAVAAARLEGR